MRFVMLAVLLNDCVVCAVARFALVVDVVVAVVPVLLDVLLAVLIRLLGFRYWGMFDH